MPRIKRAEDYYIKVLLQKVKVQEIMTTPVFSVRVDSPFSKVEQMFREHRIRHLPVVDDKNNLSGLITQRDLYRIISPRKLEDGTWYYDKEMLDEVILGQVMNSSPSVCHPEDSVGQAAVTMVLGKYGCLPVVGKDGKLCGIITQMDILKVASEILLDT